MSPSENIDAEIAAHADWRGAMMAEVRRVIHEAVPDVTEEWKWMCTPTWSKGGILCICNAFKNMVKVTFIEGAKLDDPERVFNAELTGKKWRAIKLFEGDALQARGFAKLVRDAAALNEAKAATKTKAAAKTKTATTKGPSKAAVDAPARKAAVKKARPKASRG